MSFSPRPLLLSCPLRAYAMALSLPLLLMLAAPSLAGSGQFTCTGTGGASASGGMSGGATQPAWTPPASGSSYLNTLSIPRYGISASYVASASVAISATITMTWAPGPSADPAPQSVWIVESSQAEYTGTGGTLIPAPPLQAHIKSLAAQQSLTLPEKIDIPVASD